MSRREKKATYFPPENVEGDQRVIFQDIGIIPELTGDSILWLSTLRDGLLLFDLNKREFISKLEFRPDSPQGLMTNELSRLYRARDGIYWIADKALSKLDFSSQLFNVRNVNLPDGESNLLIPHWKNQNLIWISTIQKGLIQYDLSRNKIIKWLHKPGKSGDWSSFWDASYDSRGNLWVAGAFGLSVVDPNYHEQIIPIRFDGQAQSVYTIALENDHIAWLVVGLRNLCRYDSKTG